MPELKVDRIILGDCRKVLRRLPDESVQCCVTSPPYWGLRDYGVQGQLGLEQTPEEYVGKMIDVFREVRRILRNDGTLWVNLGDCYVAGFRGGSVGIKSTLNGTRRNQVQYRSFRRDQKPMGDVLGRCVSGLKPKDIVGIPWRLAFALQADGWYLRSDIIWHKPNPMPESVQDRPTKSHEYVFLLAKSERYFYDVDAIREPYTYGEGGDHHRNVDLSGKYMPPGQASPHNGLRKASKFPRGWDSGPGPHHGLAGNYPFEKDRVYPFHPGGRTKRSVWTVGARAFKDEHFATFPEALVEPCILAGCPPGGIVLDPFIGSGTTGIVALSLGRHFVGIEISPKYAAMARRRLAQVHYQPALEIREEGTTP